MSIVPVTFLYIVLIGIDVVAIVATPHTWGSEALYISIGFLLGCWTAILIHKLINK